MQVKAVHHSQQCAGPSCFCTMRTPPLAARAVCARPSCCSHPPCCLHYLHTPLLALSSCPPFCLHFLHASPVPPFCLHFLHASLVPPFCWHYLHAPVPPCTLHPCLPRPTHAKVKKEQGRSSRQFEVLPRFRFVNATAGPVYYAMHSMHVLMQCVVCIFSCTCIVCMFSCNA